jgi:outer membrane immunogenic protein
MKRVLLTAAAALAFATSAMAADMPMKAAPYAAPAQLFNWSGLYVGGYAGWQTARAQNVRDQEPATDLDGGVYGGIVGVNYQINNWVIGLEGDYGRADADGRFVNNPTFNYLDGRTREVGNVRARLGLAYDRLLFFGAFGASFANVQFKHTVTFDRVDRDWSTWTVGGGVDWAATNNFILRLEYLYAGFGKKNYTFPGGDDHDTRYDHEHTVRVAAIWKFDWGR